MPKDRKHARDIDFARFSELLLQLTTSCLAFGCTQQWQREQARLEMRSIRISWAVHTRHVGQHVLTAS